MTDEELIEEEERGDIAELRAGQGVASVGPASVRGVRMTVVAGP